MPIFADNTLSIGRTPLVRLNRVTKGCKATVLDGEVDLGDASPYALLDTERDEGAALLCVATPRSDTVIEGEVDVEDGVAVHPVRDYAGTVTSLHDVAPGARKLGIALNTPISFNPGHSIFTNEPIPVALNATLWPSTGTRPATGTSP